MTTEQPLIIKKKAGRKIQYTKQEAHFNKRKRALDAYYINKYSNTLSKFDDRRKIIEDRLINIQDQKNQHIEKLQNKLTEQTQLNQISQTVKINLKVLVKNWKTLNKDQMNLLNATILQISTPVNVSFSECDTDINNSSGSDLCLSDTSM